MPVTSLSCLIDGAFYMDTDLPILLSCTQQMSITPLLCFFPNQTITPFSCVVLICTDFWPLLATLHCPFINYAEFHSLFAGSIYNSLKKWFDSFVVVVCLAVCVGIASCISASHISCVYDGFRQAKRIMRGSSGAPA